MEKQEAPLQKILITGATGYIGGRLVPRLVKEGKQVRVLVRSRARVLSRSWFDKVELVVGDALDYDIISKALEGMDAAYYLIHSLSKGSGFHEMDIKAARHFGQAAKEAGIRDIIYLGGLGDPKADLSHHLRSRQETGQALRESGVSVTEFRAAVIVGAGSISFEMIRYLVERLPVMICPKWIYSRIQPIAIDDLIEYLVSALNTPESRGRTIEIGGKDVTTYREMMLGYARARGLRRRLISIPILTPRLSSYWVHWMTPIPASITVLLVEGLRNDVVVNSDLARKLFPGIKPREYAAAIDGVIEDLDRGQVDTAWSDAVGASEPKELVSLESREGMVIERRSRRVDAPARNVYRVITGIGAARGWYFADWAWQLRGIADRLMGGAGLRRGRRHPDDLRVGDALDFWRVEALEADGMVRLGSEMKLPGHAWLQYKVKETGNNTTHLEQTVMFIPKGLVGFSYWYMLYPIHAWVFRGLVSAIALRAERMEARSENRHDGDWT